MVTNAGHRERRRRCKTTEESALSFDSTVRIGLGGRKGSSGSSHPLPGGGRLTVSPDGGGRGTGSSGTLTVRAVPPSCLSGRTPPLSEQELLASPVYEISMAAPASDLGRLTVSLTLPLLRLPVSLTPQTQELRLLHRPDCDAAATATEWRTLDTMGEEQRCISCRVASAGVFVCVLSPLGETFQVSPNGGLLNLKLDPIISVRIPKRGFLETAECRLTIVPFSEDKLAAARRCHPSQTMDIVALSPMYNFALTPAAEFKRPITLKLPLPQWLSETDEVDQASGNCVIVYELETSSASWRILDPGSSVKLTKNSISFETKHLARYCFLSVARGRAQRAVLAMPLLRSLSDAVVGEVMLFAKLSGTAWKLCVDCVARHDIVDRIAQRVQADGWRFLQGCPSAAKAVDSSAAASSSSPWRGRRRPVPKAQDTAESTRGGMVQLRNGAEFSVRVSGTGDVALNIGEEEAALVQFHQVFAESPAVFNLVPTHRCQTATEDFFDYLMEQGQTAENQEARGIETLVFKSQFLVSTAAGEPVSEHELTVDFSVVKEFLGLKPPTPPPTPSPPSPPPAPPSTHRDIDGDRLSRRIPVLPRLRLRVNEIGAAQARIESFQRLTAPKKNISPVISLREPRVLSGRSLQALADRVKQGLTLAVHLQLPESAITGIGFDALSGRSGLSNVTYRVLTRWKRSVPARDRNGVLVSRLIDALHQMGRPDLALVVAKHYEANQELTAASF